MYVQGIGGNELDINACSTGNEYTVQMINNFPPVFIYR